jgi:hypothetical protein
LVLLLFRVLPMTAAIMAMSGARPLLIPRIGARPLLLGGSAIAAGGLYWQSRITEHSTYAGGLPGSTIVTDAGLGLLFTPLTLVARPRSTSATPASPPACPTSASRSAAP